MPSGYVMSDELRRAIQDMVRVHSNSFQARPKRGRRATWAGGVGGVGSAPRFAIVTTEAEAASGTIGGDRTPGVGEATLYTYGAAVGDDATAGDTIEFENYMEAEVTVGKPIFVSQREGGIWVVHAEGCAAVPEE